MKLTACFAQALSIYFPISTSLWFGHVLIRRQLIVTKFNKIEKKIMPISFNYLKYENLETLGPIHSRSSNTLSKKKRKYFFNPIIVKFCDKLNECRPSVVSHCVITI